MSGTALKRLALLLPAALLAVGLAAPTLAQQYKMDPNASLNLTAQEQTKYDLGWPLILAGMLKIAYDLALLALFHDVRPPEELTPSAA
jgi:hypothetical protein